VTIRAGIEEALVAEDCALLAFSGDPADPTWLDRSAAEALLDARPSANTAPEAATKFLSEVVAASETWQSRLDADAEERAQQLEAAHMRVRDASSAKGLRYRVSPQLPVDVLGIYVYLPAPKPGSGAGQ